MKSHARLIRFLVPTVPRGNAYRISAIPLSVVKSPKAGYSLVEMLAYVVVLGTVLNLFASIFVSNTRLGALNTTALDRLRGIEELQHVFRDTVRQSSAIAPGIAEYKTAEDQLVLKAPSEVGERYIVLGILPKERKMYRLDLVEQDGELTPTYKATYPQKLAELSYASDPETDLISMEAVLHKKEGEPTGHRVVHRFAASPRIIE